MQQRHIEVLGLFIGSLLLFTLGLYHQEIIGFDSRFYLFGLEMTRHGFSWFPTTYSKPYPDYPGTATWLMYASSMLGGFNKLTAVLPSAVMAAGTVVMTYLIGEKHKRYWGWYAVGMLFLTAGFVRDARSISLDMYVTFVTVTCFYLLLVMDTQLLTRLDSKTPSHFLGYYLAMFALLAFGFAVRGPIGLVIPTSVVCLYYFVDGRLVKSILFGIVASLLLAVCCVALIALAEHVGGLSFSLDVIRMEIAGRLDNYYMPPYFYLTSSLTNYALGFPVALLSALGIIYYSVKRHKESPLPIILFQILAWVMIILIGMSIPGDKKIRYILPMMPAVALLASYPFIAPKRQHYYTVLRHALTFLLFCLPAILLFALYYFYEDLPESAWKVQGNYYSVLMCLAFLQMGCLLAWRKFQSPPRIMIFAIAAFLIVYYCMFEPAELNVEQANAFVQSVETLRANDQSPLIFYQEQEDGLPIKYIINLPKDIVPVLLQEPEELAELPSKRIVLMRTSEFSRLPKPLAKQFVVIKRGTMGHVSMMVLQKRN